MRSYEYLHVDVFTDQPFTGNPLAVFLDARGLSAEQMQKIAAEIGFSETTFVLPPETPGTDFRVRIFTPARELPMAGHPTIGTTFALAQAGRLKRTDSVTFGLGVGPTEVGLEWNPKDLRFAWMTQSGLTFGATPGNLSELARALGIREQDFSGGKLPVQEASCGVPLLFVPLVSRAAVDAAALDRSALQKFCAATNLAEMPVFIFALEEGDVTAYSRMFAPIFGIVEDPATGGASGPLGGYLVKHGAVSRERARRMVSLQGQKIGRPSRIYISIEASDNGIEKIRVGGQSVLVAEGKFHIR